MTAETGEANLATARAFVDELSRNGVRHAVICPGSRSTPMAVALASHPDLRIQVHIDERSAAFFALGMARQLRAPVALLCTSGTAAANFLPAVAEARLSRVPLIVLTADRPPEMRGWGAAQTIGQIGLFGDHVKWFVDMPVPAGDEALVRHARAAAARAVQTASFAPAGPVHLNMPYREPLLPSELRGSGIASAAERPHPNESPHPNPSPIAMGEGLYRAPCSPGPADWPIPPPLLEAGYSIFFPGETVVAELASLIAREPRGIIVCGPGEAPGLPTAAVALSAASGYPILADPLSGVRFGPHDRAGVIDAYDPMLRDERAASVLRPEVVIRVGAIPTSKPLQQFLLADPGRAHLVVDAGEPRDPSHLATSYVRADPPATLRAIAGKVERFDVVLDRGWRETWRAMDRVTRNAIDQALEREEELFEGRVAAEVAALLPDGTTLVAGNSMPIRDVDAFVRGDERCLRVQGNRGANGIDGMTSTALGAAAVAEGPVVLLVGDLSFLHDLGGLLAARRFGLTATIVVLNNDGGGIFSFLPQAEQLDTPTFEALFGTPAGLDIGAAARLFGASYARPADWRAFRRDVRRALDEPGLSIVEVATDRAKNVVQHREVWAAVSAALQTVESFDG